MIKKLLKFLKSRIRKIRWLEGILFFIYTRFTFSYRFLQSNTINYLINILKALVIKKEIAGLSITSKNQIIETRDGNKFYWDVNDRESLLGMGLAGTWEHDDTEYLKRIIKKRDIAIDIGANFGFHTVLFSKLVGPSGKVYSFEPLSSMYEELEKNILLNGIKQNISLHKLALGQKAGKLKIYVPERMGRGAAALVERGASIEKETCRVLRLDTFINSQKINSVDFIKCDIEGGELLALRGAVNVLKRFHPKLMIEINRGGYEAFGYTPEELVEFIEKFNYVFYSVVGRKLIRIKKEDVPYFHGNCFALPN